jgi:hypothetical protein
MGPEKAYRQGTGLLQRASSSLVACCYVLCQSDCAVGVLRTLPVAAGVRVYSSVGHL